MDVRNAIGVDVNRDALMVAFDRLNFDYRPLDEDYVKPSLDLFQGECEVEINCFFKISPRNLEIDEKHYIL